jgi:Kef-type K+ transport system membrane component KefB
MTPSLLHSPLVLFVTQAILIIAVARTVGVLARRVGQPMVIAEVTAGILLGPSLLGWLAPTLYANLFPAQSMPALQIFSQVGLLLFMFLIGLELDPKLLRGRGRTSLLIGKAGIVVPFVLGSLLALYLYPRVSEPATRQLSFVLFMGTAMSITAFPVLARILSERRLLRSNVGIVAITSAAIADVAAWCLLAFVISVVRGQSHYGPLRTLVLTAVFIAVMVLVVRPFLRRLGEQASSREGLTQNMVAVTFLLLLLSSWATELIGIHALFGAFLFGVLLPKEGSFATSLADKLEDLVVVLLLPIFFAYSGLRTQLGLSVGSAVADAVSPHRCGGLRRQVWRRHLGCAQHRPQLARVLGPRRADEHARPDGADCAQPGP